MYLDMKLFRVGAVLGIVCCAVSQTAYAQFTQSTPFAATGTTSPRPLVDRANDVYNVADDGAICDGSATNDISGALTKTILRSRNAVYGDRTKWGAIIQLPMGRCVVSTSIPITLTDNQSLVLRGFGPFSTELIFSSTDGLLVTYSSASDVSRDDVNTGASFQLSDISVVQQSASTSGYGLFVAGDSHNIYGTNEPNTIIRDVVFRGTANGGGWSVGAKLLDAANTSLQAVTVYCPLVPRQVGAPGSGVGVQYGTSTGGRATLHSVVNLATDACLKGMDIGQRIEGVAVVNGNFTAGSYGIYWDSGATSREEVLSVANSAFSNLVSDIWVRQVQNVQVTNSTFFNQNSYVSPPGGWAAVTFYDVAASQITGNGISGIGNGTEYGIVISNDTAEEPGTIPNVISGNTISTVHGPAFYARLNTNNVLFAGNASSNIAQNPPVSLDPGTSLISFSGNTWEKALSPVGYPSSPAFTMSAGPIPVFTNLAAALPLNPVDGTLWNNGGLLGISTNSSSPVAVAIVGNLNHVVPSFGQGAIGWNFSGGGAEIDFFNNTSAAYSTAFSWYQASSATVPNLVMSLSTSGDLSVGRSLAVPNEVQTGLLTITGNLGGGAYLSHGQGAIGWNNSSGRGEIDFINNVSSLSGGFSWYQTSVLGTVTPVLSLSGSGDLTVPSSLNAETIAVGNELQSPILTINGNLGASGFSPHAEAAIGWNYSSGLAELDFFNNHIGASVAFQWYKRTGSSTFAVVGSLDGSGLLTANSFRGLSLPTSPTGLASGTFWVDPGTHTLLVVP